MRAMVLAAGYGTRLGDLTKEWPKPMLDVNGRPMIGYIICHLVKYGYSEIAVNLHFMPDIIQNYFGDGELFGAKITYSYEQSLLGTAGGVRKMGDYLGAAGAFLVQYGDVVTDQDFEIMFDFHCKSQAMVTMLVHQRIRSNSIVNIDEKGRVLNFIERPTEELRRTVTSPWVNSGICICEPGILDFIPPHSACDLPRDIFPKIMTMGRLFAFPLSGYRCAVDSPERLEELRSALSQGRCRI